MIARMMGGNDCCPPPLLNMHYMCINSHDAAEQSGSELTDDSHPVNL